MTTALHVVAYVVVVWVAVTLLLGGVAVYGVIAEKRAEARAQREWLQRRSGGGLWR